MFTFSNEEYTDIHFVYGLCNGNGRAAVEEYRRRFPTRRVPCRTVFSNVHRCLRETGKFPTAISERPVQQELAQEEAILNTIDAQPSTSVRRIANTLNVGRMRVWRTLHNFGLYPYHILPVQALKPADYASRLEFSRWILRNQRICQIILFSDEASFTRNGINNTRNSHCWALENPRQTRESHFQDRFSVNVWCGIIDDRLIGPFILEERLTAIRYLRFIENDLPILLDDVPLNVRQRMWIQHDGAPPHFGRQVTEFLNQNYTNRWIGRGSAVPWPARSPDFNPLDYFLWGRLKNLVYAENIENREQLVARIMDAAETIRADPETVSRATTSILRRARLCIQQLGGHFEQLIQ